MKETKERRFTVRIPQSLWRKLFAQALKVKRYPSEIVRFAIEEYVMKEAHHGDANDN